MNNKKIIFLLFLFGYSIKANSQTLYLKPFGGVQSLLCSYDKKIGKVNTFKINYLHTAADLGFLLDYKLNDKLSLMCGISFSTIGWSYSLEVPKNLTKNPYGISDKRMHSEGIIMHRFPILINYTFSEKSLLKSKEGDTKESLQFKIGGGINIDNVPDIMTKDDTLSINWPSFYGDTIKYSNEWNYIDRDVKTGISLATNFNICLHNKIKNKDILELTFYYNQGLFNIINIDVHYQLNSIHSYSKLYSKGTSYGVILSIPIRIWHKSSRTYSPKGTIKL